MCCTCTYDMFFYVLYCLQIMFISLTQYTNCPARINSNRIFVNTMKIAFSRAYFSDTYDLCPRAVYDSTLRLIVSTQRIQLFGKKILQKYHNIVHQHDSRRVNCLHPTKWKPKFHPIGHGYGILSSSSNRISASTSASYHLRSTLSPGNGKVSNNRPSTM